MVQVFTPKLLFLSTVNNKAFSRILACKSAERKKNIPGIKTFQIIKHMESSSSRLFQTTRFGKYERCKNIISLMHGQHVAKWQSLEWCNNNCRVDAQAILRMGFAAEQIHAMEGGTTTVSSESSQRNG